LRPRCVPGKSTMRKSLTVPLIDSLKPPATGRLECSDLKCSGLSYRLTSNGHRGWCFRYRCPLSGRTLRYKLGAYPDVSLKAARLAADKLRASVAAGASPAVQRRRERVERNERSFAKLAELMLSMPRAVRKVGRKTHASYATMCCRNGQIAVMTRSVGAT
jgi:hypothetical protein